MDHFQIDLLLTGPLHVLSNPQFPEGQIGLQVQDALIVEDVRVADKGREMGQSKDMGDVLSRNLAVV
jgi:hypothetical protein